MAVVVFDPVAFREAYPRFSSELISDAQLEQAFDLACLLLDNTDASPVPYDPEQGILIRRTLLWLLVCHIATMALWPSGQSGPLSSATEGSVSVSFSLPQNIGRAYYSQTPCGQTFWQAVQPYVVGGRYYVVRHYHPWG